MFLTCGGEDTVPGVMEYDPSDGVNKVVIFVENEQGSYLPMLPFDFPVEGWLTSSNVRETEAELVACLTVLDLKERGHCSYRGASSSGTIIKFRVTYEITLYEAATGEVLATGQISGPEGDCPQHAGFAEDNVKVQYGLPSKDELVAFLRPYVEP
jgi:hypothetical protein